MRNIGILLLIISASFSTAQEQFIIADSKNLPATIIIPNDSTKELKSLADELKKYLNELSGQKFQVSTNKVDGRMIILGTLKQLDLASLQLAAKFRETGKSHKEAYLIKTSKKSLILTAETELGISHAVFKLLDSFGCRWFFPSQTWEVIPEKKNLTVSADIFDYPKIPSRRIWYQWGFIHDEIDGNKRSSQDYKNWARHNCMASGFKTSIGHVWGHLYSIYKEEFDAHPEYFLWNVAKERYDTAEFNKAIKIDTYHPGVEAIFKKYVLDYFKKYPNADMVGTGPSDGYTSGLISKINPEAGPSEIAFHGTDIAAKALLEAAKSDPLYKNKYVGQYAYADYSDPPSFLLEDNVYIELTGGFISGTNSYTELLDLWPRYVTQMGFYRYYSVFQWNLDTLPGGQGANTIAIRKNIPQLYHKQHASSISAESGNNWGLHGRGYYLANKLMWEPDADSDLVLEDFYHNAFGPAADVMKEYYESFDPGNNPFMCKYLLGVGADLIREAGELTKDNPEYSARIDDLKVFWGYVMLRWNYDKAVTAKDEKLQMQYAKEICEHAYRSRLRYMNHWEAIRQQWLGGGGLDIPEWKNVNTAPWKGMPDYTKPEIDTLFKKVQSYFPRQHLATKKFSANLVPIQWPKMDERVEKQEGGIWQGGHTILYYSFGESINISLKINITGRKGKATLTLKDKAGKLIDSQSILAAEPRECSFSFKVPKAGLYQIYVENNFWRMYNYRVDTPMMLSTKTKYLHHGYQTPTSFYVPKGVDQISFIGYFSGDCTLYSETYTDVLGTVLASKNGEVQTIKVPEGEDGKVWSFRNVLVNRIWFLNVPNYIGYSPSGVMVPAEVAKKDGLTIRTCL